MEPRKDREQPLGPAKIPRSFAVLASPKKKPWAQQSRRLGRLKNPLDSDLSIGQRYPAFERPGPADVWRLNTGIQAQLHRCQLSRRNSIRLVLLLRSGVIMQAPVVQKLDSAIHRIPVRETNCAIQWIVRIYPVDSVIHLLNNWDQEYGISCVNRKVVV